MAAATRTPLMAGNWKMNLDHQQATHLVQKLAWTLEDAKHDYEAVEVAVLPPFTDIRSVQTLIDGDKLGRPYVVVGHSERRQYHGEDDALVNAKLRAARRHGLVPILCVGESLDVRREGDQVDFTLAQLTKALENVALNDPTHLVVAYEPVWAIGTGEVATPQDAQEVCGAIRGRLEDLYSGSVASSVRVL